MSETTKVKGLNRDNAVLLLAAAEELGYESRVVTLSDGAFVAPSDVVEKAGLNKERATAKPSRTARQAKDEAEAQEKAPAEADAEENPKASAKTTKTKKEDN